MPVAAAGDRVTVRVALAALVAVVLVALVLVLQQQVLRLIRAVAGAALVLSVGQPLFPARVVAAL
jgi:hypothetical protein